MGLLDKLIGGTTVSAVEGIANVINQFVETDDEKAAQRLIMAKIAQKPALAQVELNRVEAGHRSLFVAGWRPALGWSCALGLLFAFVINPLLEYFTETRVNVPTDIMMELVIAMLGLGGLRTIEKLSGRAK